jgi:hypothetical protein
MTQQGQRDSVATRAALNVRRTVAIEFGMCRSGRNGGTPRAVSFGIGISLNSLAEPVPEGGIVSRWEARNPYAAMHSVA